MERMEKLRILLLGDKDDTNSDEIIEVLDDLAENRFMLILNRYERLYEKEVSELLPEKLAWIIDEVLIKRFNRLGSEGYASQSIEGQSVTFFASDFAEFDEDIREFVAGQTKVSPGRLVIY